jgi:hypothetical protein
MADWLVTHYPHPHPDDLPWHIYLQRHHRHVVDGIAVGDLVLFYEYRDRKAERRPKSDCLTGAQGIVRTARVSGPVYERPDRDAVIEYEDGSVGDWRWGIPTEDPDVNGFVSRPDLLRVIGYKPGSYLRGFNGGTGVMRLDATQGATLLRLFRAGVSPRIWRQ